MARGESTGTEIPAVKREAYIKAKRDGYSTSAAARKAQISRTTAYAIEKDLDRERERRERRAGNEDALPAGGNPWVRRPSPLDEEELPDPKWEWELSPAAKRAQADFAYFRARYFGRARSPWQEQAGERMLELLESPEKTFVVVNTAPGGGKTTLFCHDLVCWLIARNRAVRIMVGSRTYSQAARYSGRVRRSLQQRVLAMPADEHIRRGLAVVPEATLVEDYGRFRPDDRVSGDVWQKGAFIVAQPGDVLVSEKEPTVSAFGFDGDVLGTRIDVAIWDDLVDYKNIRTQDQRDELIDLWELVSEKRLEPGGLLILQGQRLAANDFYRYCLDQRVPAFDEDGELLCDENGDPLPPRRKYSLITYPAHDEARCRGLHSLRAPPWDGTDQGGCLLDPKRLSWRELAGEEARYPDRFRVMYQQEDVDPHAQLVPFIWINGGRDPDTGEQFPGCLDEDRRLCQVPSGLSPPLHSYATLDPAQGAGFWALQWWCFHPESERRYLLDLARLHLQAPDLLDWHPEQGRFTGVMEQWQIRSVDLGLPIRHWITEQNAAQRFLFQYKHVERWISARSVTIVPHQCVDTATEVLSQRGWLTSAEVEAGDLILTLNTDTARSEWQPVEFVYRGLHDGPMMRIGSRNLDALCTLDHRWPVGHQRDRRLRFVESKDLNFNQLVPLARPLAPGQEPEPVYSDDLVELVAWSVTEGHFRRRRRSPGDTAIDIGQSERVNGPNVLRIRSLLKRMGAHWREDPPRPKGVVVMTVTGPIAQAVRRITQDRIYIPPGFVAALTAEQRALLLEVFVLADGWTHGKTASFCNDEESLIAAYEMASALNGRPTHRATRTDRPHHKVVRNKYASDAYLGNPGVRPTVVDFTGEIWCPSTVNGTFYARRGGVTYFTGNTQRNRTDQDRGVETIKYHYRFGRVRLPWATPEARAQVNLLIREITRWPDAATNDQVLCQWFGEFHLPRLFPPKTTVIHRQRRPSWLRSVRPPYSAA